MEPLMPTLTITPDSAFAILIKAREFDSKVTETDPDSGSNPSDDNSVDALEFGPSDATHHELVSAIHDLNDDEQRDLIALICWDAVTSPWVNGPRRGKGRPILVGNEPRATSAKSHWSATTSRTACPNSTNRSKTIWSNIETLTRDLWFANSGFLVTDNQSANGRRILAPIGVAKSTSAHDPAPTRRRSTRRLSIFNAAAFRCSWSSRAAAS
jgi:hypothetical protein